jgi:transposase
MSMEGAAEGEAFRIYIEELLCPSLSHAQIVVMDNLSVHKNRRVRDLIEARGCELWFLPASSPDLNLVEEAFSKRRPSPK